MFLCFWHFFSKKKQNLCTCFGVFFSPLWILFNIPFLNSKLETLHAFTQAHEGFSRQKLENRERKKDFKGKVQLPMITALRFTIFSSDFCPFRQVRNKSKGGWKKGDNSQDLDSFFQCSNLRRPDLQKENKVNRQGTQNNCGKFDYTLEIFLVCIQIVS